MREAGESILVSMARSRKSKEKISLFEHAIQDFQNDVEGLIFAFPITVRPLIKKALKASQNFKAFEKTAIKGTKTGFLIKSSRISEFEKLHHQSQVQWGALNSVSQSLLISLISHFDHFLGKMVELSFRQVPELLNGTEKKISVVEILEIDNLTNARDFLIRREVDSLLHENRWNCIKWLEEKLKVDFKIDEDLMRGLVEAAERRNLFVHSGAIVTKDYIATCKKFGVPLDPTLKVGAEIRIDPKHFYESAAIVFNIGVQMGHVVWRKLVPKEMEISDISIINLSSDLLKEQKNKRALRLLNFATGLSDFFDDKSKLIMIINKALALKQSKKIKEAHDLIAKHSWSHCDNDLKIAVAMLLGNKKDVLSFMEKIGPDREMSWAYGEWPLFSKFNKTPAFKKAYSKIYKKPFVIEKDRKKDRKRGFKI